MRRMGKQTWLKQAGQWILIFILACSLISPLPTTVHADTGKTEVSGKVFEFDNKSHYEFEEAEEFAEVTMDNSYGTFFIDGNIVLNENQSDIPNFEVSEGSIQIFYNHGDWGLTDDKDAWHLVDDKSKQLGNEKLSSSIKKGAIVLQTSKNGKDWLTVKTITNAFAETPVRTDSIYETQGVELLNGCYYRMIVGYQQAVRTEESSIWFVNTDKYDQKKTVEVYEFYARMANSENNPENSNQTYSLGTKERVKNYSGYYGTDTISKNDMHYGWDLGNFFVSGYTDAVKKENGEVVFLKNPGDKVTLWFRLEQDIDQLNGKKNLSITADKSGYDQYFQTAEQNFGYGAMIIRYTDYNNVKAEPVIYRDYLKANATAGADTRVQLFEEGDYEVALDYQITSDELIDKSAHYRIAFDFSVRNGNCMVYPFDVKTGNELTNSSMTENGFRLDLAKSRYLKINLKREVLTSSADGLVEDTRFNGPAKDGAEYTDEGIYSITVSNENTGQLTTKKIYVGTNSVMKAYMTTGLSINEINDMVANGATIGEDGTIHLTQGLPIVVPADPDTPVNVVLPSEESTTEQLTIAPATNGGPSFMVILLGIGVVVIVAAALILKGKKKAAKSPVQNQSVDKVTVSEDLEGPENTDSEDLKDLDNPNSESDNLDEKNNTQSELDKKSDSEKKPEEIDGGTEE